VSIMMVIRWQQRWQDSSWRKMKAAAHTIPQNCIYLKNFKKSAMAG